MRVALSNSALLARKALRATLRRKRRALTPRQRLLAAEAVATHVDRSLHLRAGQRIALYAALEEELDTAPLMWLAHERGCEVYLPRIVSYRTCSMRFHLANAAHVRGESGQRNRFGIYEPQGARFLGARWLDLAFLPLVGFDARGARLGMGAGFYDRAFAYRRIHRAWKGPLLIGLGYSFQEVQSIETDAHDVGLDAVVTEERMRWIHTCL